MFYLSVCTHVHMPVYERERLHKHHLRNRRTGTKGAYLTMSPFLLNIVDGLLGSFGKVQKLPA